MMTELDILDILTKMGRSAGNAISNVLETPVIGISRKDTHTTRTGRTGTVTNYSFEIRGWEIFLGLAIFAVYEAWTSMISWFTSADPLYYVDAIAEYIDRYFQSISEGTAKPSPSGMSLMQYLESKIIIALDSLSITDLMDYLEKIPIGQTGENYESSNKTNAANLERNLVNEIEKEFSGLKKDITSIPSDVTGLIRSIAEKLPDNIGKDMHTVARDIETVVHGVATKPINDIKDEVEHVSDELKKAVENNTVTKDIADEATHAITAIKRFLGGLHW